MIPAHHPENRRKRSSVHADSKNCQIRQWQSEIAEYIGRTHIQIYEAELK
jgi:hypothetical protein